MFLNIVEPEIRTIVAPMAERTMEELLRAPTEGYGEAIVLPEINADHFEIKTNLLQLVQANPFYGRENDNPHAHINSFKRITSTLRFRNVPNDVIKLMMFPYSLEGAAKTWYEKEPPNSILTWEDLALSSSEAWERFKELLRACPHHGFTELTQVDTFYNGLNDNEQDSLNAAAGGNLLSKMTREALNIIENKSKVRYSRNKPNASRMNATSSKTDERIDKLADQLSTLVEIVSKKVVLTLRRNENNEESTDKEQTNFKKYRSNPTPVIHHFYSGIPDVATTLPKTIPNSRIDILKRLAEDVFVKVGKFHFPTDFVVVDFEADPRVPLILGRSFLRTGRDLIDVYGEEITLLVDSEAVTFNLDQTTRYSSMNDKSVNRIDIIDAVCEEYAPELLGFSNTLGGNPTLTSDPFTFEFILEEIEAYLKDYLISPEIDYADCNPEEDICLIEKILNK
ncbi:reverse transcriptase domain-containing protein [Tanacetum coccineum]